MNDDADPGQGERSGPSAWDTALRLLGVRARSRQEMLQRLERRGFDPDTIDEVMARLENHRLLDDADFAAQWVHSRHTHSGRGRVALRHELRAKGIDETTISATLSEVDPEDEREIAANLVARKLTVAMAERAKADPAERDKIKRRLLGMLVRRGYPQSMALDVVSEALVG